MSRVRQPEEQVFDKFSDRSRMVVFLARKDAGRRGATTLEPGHLLDALVREDQGELAARFAGAVTTSGPIRPPEAFFSAEAASKLLLRLEQILPPQAQPVEDSTDMPVSTEFGHILTAATALAKELHHNRVEPLHLVAAMLSQETSGTGETLRGGGISREAVLAAIRT